MSQYCQCDDFKMVEDNGDSFAMYQGLVGPHYTPSVAENGDLSWTNNGGLPNPETVNIRGPQGEQGPEGPQGPDGPQGPQGEPGITPEEISAINNQLAELAAGNAPVIINTASGEIASFSDGADGMPVKKLEVAINPVQDLHGYDHPWPAGGEKNKLTCNNSAVYNRIINGITFTVTRNADNDVLSIAAKGTSTARVTMVLNTHIENQIPNGDYILSGCPSGGGNGKYRLTCWDDTASVTIANDYGSGRTFMLDATHSVNCAIDISAGQTVDIVYYPMIRLATEADATFAPYSNICPISGWTGANDVVSPTQDASDGKTYSTSWQDEAGTIYGGLRTYNGDGTWTLTVIPGYIPSYNSETLSGNYISSQAAPNTTPVIGSQVFDFGATPITYTLTTEELITTLKGVNNVWADTGEITELEYPADTKLYIDQKIAAAVAALS